jgi:hypothetical protein
MHRDRLVFLLSPARCDGKRARILLSSNADFALAKLLREPEGTTIGEAFAFLSGLYFRGKVAYARAYAATEDVHVITTDRGLMHIDARVGPEDLARFSSIDLAKADERYLAPLRRDVQALASQLSDGDRVVLLGSIATGKYTSLLLDALGERLLFPRDFVGRGDMSRGGLMLRCANEGRALEYVPVIGAVRHGKRPPKLEPIRRK